MLAMMLANLTSNEEERRFFLRVYEKYARLMYRTIRNYTTDIQDIEDVMQNSLEKLLRRLHKLMQIPEGALATYIVYTVRSEAINFLKHQSRIHMHENRETEEYSAYRDTSIIEKYIESYEDQWAFASFWEKVDQDDRKLLYLKYIWKMSDYELADILNCKSSSVRMKLTRAKRRVQEIARQEGLYHDPT